MRYIQYPLEIKELDLKKGSFEVDIGGMSEDEHQSAFIKIFEDTLSQNNLSLENLKVKKENIDVKDADFFSSPSEFASYLYSLYLPEIGLIVLFNDTRQEITIKFDNPAFFLEAK